MGYTAKVFAVYPSPFWRKGGLSGISLSDTGPGALVFDNSPPDGSIGVLLALCVGDPARRWGAKGPAARRAAVLNEFALLHGDRARHPVRYLEQIWPAEEFSRGGSTMFVPPGTFTEITSAWRDPVGRIHWASTETASVNTGTMDGAIESGKRAAAEVHGGPVPPPTPPFTG
jgi:monoamine oxidase